MYMYIWIDRKIDKKIEGKKTVPPLANESCWLPEDLKNYINKDVGTFSPIELQVSCDFFLFGAEILSQVFDQYIHTYIYVNNSFKNMNKNEYIIYEYIIAYDIIYIELSLTYWSFEPKKWIC